MQDNNNVLKSYKQMQKEAQEKEKKESMPWWKHVHLPQIQRQTHTTPLLRGTDPKPQPPLHLHVWTGPGPYMDVCSEFSPETPSKSVQTPHSPNTTPAKSGSKRTLKQVILDGYCQVRRKIENISYKTVDAEIRYVSMSQNEAKLPNEHGCEFRLVILIGCTFPE